MALTQSDINAIADAVVARLSAMTVNPPQEGFPIERRINMARIAEERLSRRTIHKKRQAPGSD